MSKNLTYLSILLLVFLISCSKAKVSEQEALLVGTWELKISEPALMSGVGVVEYKSDKTCHGEASFKMMGESMSFTFSATWIIADGKLITKITKSSDPELLKVGSEEVDIILQLDEKVFTYRDSEGDVYSETRKK